jgi:uncharacterized protein YcbX
VRVTGLYRYPVKSARGVSLPEARLGWMGIEGDRRWAILGSDGKVITQRDCPALATLAVRRTRGGIRLSAPGCPDLAVDRPSPGSRSARIDIWGDVTEGVHADSHTGDWLLRFLGRQACLVFMPEEIQRSVDRRYGGPGDRVGFADGYPFLLTSEASLADLNARLDAPVPMDRFRPNLVVDGEAGFEEDDWVRIRVGKITFRVVKACPRCVVTTVDQRTGIPGREPLRALAEFRKRDGRVLFGQNLIHDQRGMLRVGDEVEVLERRAGA